MTEGLREPNGSNATASKVGLKVRYATRLSREPERVFDKVAALQTFLSMHVILMSLYVLR